MSETYTRQQILDGEGLYTQQSTAIYRRSDGRYVTAGINNVPSSALELAAYAHPRQGKRRPAKIIWV